LIENTLARIADVTTAIRSGKVGFLLTASNCLNNLRELNCHRLIGLDDLIYLLVVSVRY